LGKIPFRAWLGQRSLLLTAPENRHYAKGNVIILSRGYTVILYSHTVSDHIFFFGSEKR
jgi:hypothetical protein